MSATIDTAGRRAAYRREGIDAGDLAADPLTQFHRWHDDWRATGPYDAAAAVLATVDPRGRPSARWIDVPRVDDGFVFFTGFGSRKATDLAVDPRASLCFGWLEVGRQVRADGTVSRLGDTDADEYFAALPRRVQVLAWATDQRMVVSGRDVLERDVAEAGDRFGGQEVPRPAFWGGYRLVPDEMEFWQSRADEIQDRFRYRREDGEWLIERVAP